MENRCTSLLARLCDVVEAKRAGVEKADLKTLLSQTAVQIVKLRQAAKQQVEDVEQHKSDTAQSRAEVDVSNLQLQNLLYEKNYYTKEIATCKNFRSKYTDEQIELVPVEEFKGTAPPRFLEDIQDEHKLQRQRLELEKHQRLEALKDLQAVKQQKAEHDQLMAGKRKYLEDIQTHFSSLKESAGMLRTQLELPAHDATERHKLLVASALLPVPLYVLFHQLAAVKEAFDEDIKVTITGSRKEAETWAQSSGAEVFERADLETAPPQKRRKAERKSQSIDTDYVQHPLALWLEVGVPVEKPLVLHFHYLPRLECVTVRCEDPAQQHLLGSLFLEDSGADLLNELPQQKAGGCSFEFDGSRVDRPYRWAQHLAGMDFLPALTQSGALEHPAGKYTIASQMAAYREQQRVQTVLQKLRAAAAASAHASANLSSLPVVVDTDASRAPPVKRIMTWEEIVQSRSRPTTPQNPVLNSSGSLNPEKPAPDVVPPVQHDSDEEEGQLPEGQS